ncbi:MAG: hypothetical protein CMI26_03040 [Opitutae bacterium]|nr:hypothetical protein [Opitutae bacterium]|tara:strand:- start:6045 stop:6623 length:579 start_codon:yes stop_codon:yes gene_type:complete
MNSFADDLAAILREHPENLTDLAQKACISRPSLYDLINGKNLPRPTTLGNLITALELSEKAAQKLHDAHRSERLRTNRKEQDILLKEKKILLSEISDLLLQKGHEISRSNHSGGPDLILRSGSRRIPLHVTSRLIEHPAVLGHLLEAMHNLSTSTGYACVPKLTHEDRFYLPLFAKYGVKILTHKNLLRELK